MCGWPERPAGPRPGAWARAPRLCGGCVGQEEWRRSSPRRSGVDGAERRRPRRREDRRRLRLAPGTAGEDEGCEGGSKMENGDGLGGSHRGGRRRSEMRRGPRRSWRPRPTDRVKGGRGRRRRAQAWVKKRRGERDGGRRF
jgi:hypothetical protein